MTPEALLTKVIRPTLTHLARAKPAINSVPAQQLLLGTALHESLNTRFTRQLSANGLETGPAQSWWQLELSTARDVLERYLPQRQPLLCQPMVDLLAPWGDWPNQLEHNQAFACAVARMRYWMDPTPLPSAGDWQGLAETYKRVYNTAGGAGSPADFLRAIEPATALW